MTRQYPRDTSVPSYAPRLIDEDPSKVLAAAREILNSQPESEEWDWVESIIIYELEMGRHYSIWNASNLEHMNRDGVYTVAYAAWWDTNNKPHESFHGDFNEKCNTVSVD